LTTIDLGETRLSALPFPLKPLLAVLAIGTAIAALAGFDRVFDALTGGSAILRMVAFALIATLGATCAARAGMRIAFYGTRHPVLTGLAAALVVAVWVALIDGVVFRTGLSQAYVRYFHTTGLGGRLEYFMLRAFNENVLYRLFLFSVLARALGTVWRGPDGRPATPALWVAMVSAQIVNIAINVVLPTADTVTATSLVYDAVRYVAPGVAWAWLFARFGFATAEIASVGCHLFLQPMLGAVL
jgi:hypothetical protein